MIKKILLLLFLLFFCVLFIIYALIDKIYINNYIKNLEESLKINIYLEEPHQFIVIPHLALLANFNLDNKEKKLMTEEGAIFDLTLLKTEENTQHYLTQDGVGMVFRWKTIKNKKYPYILEIYREKKEGQYMKCFKYKNTQI